MDLKIASDIIAGPLNEAPDEKFMPMIIDLDRQDVRVLEVEEGDVIAGHDYSDWAQSLNLGDYILAYQSNDHIVVKLVLSTGVSSGKLIQINGAWVPSL